MGIVGASIFGITIGLVFGIPVDRIMMLYVLPIMGGGNGAGAVPLSRFTTPSPVVLAKSITQPLSLF